VSGRPRKRGRSSFLGHVVRFEVEEDEPPFVELPQVEAA
jgi:hypothetical protein